MILKLPGLPEHFTNVGVNSVALCCLVKHTLLKHVFSIGLPQHGVYRKLHKTKQGGSRLDQIVT